MATQGRTNVLDARGAAAAVAKAAALPPPAAEHLRPDHTPKAYLAALADAGLLHDAVRFLAFALPRREGVWWAAQCVRAVPPLAADEHAPALTAAEAWAADPTDKNRRAAFAEAEKVGFATPAACCAMAAFWAEGSMSPPDNPAVPPPEHVGPGAAANAVILAAVSVEPEKAGGKLRAFLALGDQVAAGANRWPEGKRGTGPLSAPVAASAPDPRPVVPPPPPPPPPRSWY